MVLHCTESKSAAPFNPSTFSPLGLSRSRHMGLPHIFKLHAYFHHKYLFCLLSLLEDSTHASPNDWLFLLEVSPEILTFRKSWEFHQPEVVSPAQSCISSYSYSWFNQTLYHTAIFFKTLITIYYYLEFIYFLLSLEYNYHEGRNYTWLMHHGTSRT